MNTPMPFLRKLALNYIHNFEGVLYENLQPWQIIKLSTFFPRNQSSLVCFFHKISK